MLSRLSRQFDELSSVVLTVGLAARQLAFLLPQPAASAARSGPGGDALPSLAPALRWVWGRPPDTPVVAPPHGTYSDADLAEESSSGAAIVSPTGPSSLFRASCATQLPAYNAIFCVCQLALLCSHASWPGIVRVCSMWAIVLTDALGAIEVGNEPNTAW